MTVAKVFDPPNTVRMPMGYLTHECPWISSRKSSISRRQVEPTGVNTALSITGPRRPAVTKGPAGVVLGRGGWLNR